MRPRLTPIVTLIAWLASTGAIAAAGQPLVRVTLEPKGRVVVGQQVKVNVQVLVPNFFMSALAFPPIDIPGAIVSRPDDSAEHVTETINGESYAGIQQSFVVTPQRAGEFTLPSAKITFQYAAVPGQASSGAVTLPPAKFTAKLPPGVAPSATTAGAPAEPVARVTISQSLDHDVKSLKVGDTLTRTVSAFAERTQAMMIPPPTFDAPDGVRVYRKDPVLADETKDRTGFVGGRRTDRVTYLFEKPGRYTLPAIDIAWFDVKTGKQESARAPAIEVSVAENPRAAPAIAPEPPPPVDATAGAVVKRVDWRRWAPWAIGTVLGALLLAWLARRYTPRYRTWRAARRREREESEPAYFARAERACRSNDAPAAYRALGAWAWRAGAVSLTTWCNTLGDGGLRSQAVALERALFAAGKPGEAWDGPRFAAAIAGARRTWLASRDHGAVQPQALPALNP